MLTSNGNHSSKKLDEDSEQKLETEVAPALIAVHPTHESVAVSIGPDIRVFNLRQNSQVALLDEHVGHKDLIRAIRYSPDGNIFVSAGDDKLVKIWDTHSWLCVYSIVSEKRVTALAISSDGAFVCFADKFGVVYVVEVGERDENGSALADKKAIPILSHYCSIITRLEFSPDGHYIVSADRDFKIRVTVFPKIPSNGAHEITSFCLGHVEFVSCLAFVSSLDRAQDFLVSGSGDSTVRLWDHTSGSLLDTCNVGAEAGLLHFDGKEDETFPVVTDICATFDGYLIAVVIQSFSGVMLLNCNHLSGTLSVVKVVSVPEDAFIPTSISASSSVPVLWMAMGASSIRVQDSKSIARVRAITGFISNSSESIDHEITFMEDTEIPGGESLLEALQGKLSIGREAFITASEAVKTSMRNLLIKKQYSAERQDFRKRGRNDKKCQNAT